MLRTTISSLGARSSARLPSTIRSSTLTTSSPLRTFTQRTLTISRPIRRPSPSTNFTFTFSSHARPTATPQSILQRLRHTFRSFNTSRRRLDASPNPTPNLGSPGGANAEPTSLSGKLKKLSREYGWSALGVYFALTALDFPFCYLFVRSMGTDRIGEWEHKVLTAVKGVIPDSVKQSWREWRSSMKKAEKDITGNGDISEHVEMVGWGVEEANEANKRDASLATQLALAYAIHKSFIFIRVPITVAITPKVVKMLRGWGWDIGKRTTKEAKALKRAANPPKSKKSS